MKTTTTFTSAVMALAGTAAAFPAAMFESEGFVPFMVERAVESAKVKRGLPPYPGGSSNPGFNATFQYVSNQGAHAFVAPGPGDERGMCPGLNAMANHGYLPHNGIATPTQFIDGTFSAFGMAEDLGAFLAYYGVWVDGNGANWSIESGPMVGIGGSHNNYETDSSPLKSDLYQYGTNSKLVMEQFYELYNMQPNAATANYSLDVMRDFRGTRYQESIAKNPYYAYLPFSGILVSQAAFTFIFRFMGNKSAEYPSGTLNKATLKSFMSISGPENNLTWTFGHEAFPDNFYKRASGDEYSVPYFFSDILYFAEKYPEILSVGCNTGSVNSFVSIPPEQLTGGAVTQAQVNANPLCYAMQMSLPSSLVSLLGSSALSGVRNAISTGLSKIGAGPCTTIPTRNLSAMSSVCPGFQGFYGGPNATVAPGAIQN